MGILKFQGTANSYVEIFVPSPAKIDNSDRLATECPGMKTIILILLLSGIYMVASAQDPVKISPQYYKVLLENDQVRVLEYRLKPGKKEPMHMHPAGVVYVLSGATLKLSYPNGRSEEKTAASGETIWRDPVTHAIENTGKTEAHAIAIDLKTEVRKEKEGLKN